MDAATLARRRLTPELTAQAVICMEANRCPCGAPLSMKMTRAYLMLATGAAYHELGEAYVDQMRQTRTVANLKRRLETWLSHHA
jgi:hypothetical protein